MDDAGSVMERSAPQDRSGPVHFVRVWLTLLDASPRWAVAGMTPAYRVRVSSRGGLDRLRIELGLRPGRWAVATEARPVALDRECVDVTSRGTPGSPERFQVQVAIDPMGWAIDDICY